MSFGSHFNLLQSPSGDLIDVDVCVEELSVRMVKRLKKQNIDEQHCHLLSLYPPHPGLSSMVDWKEFAFVNMLIRDCDKVTFVSSPVFGTHTQLFEQHSSGTMCQNACAKCSL